MTTNGTALHEERASIAANVRLQLYGMMLVSIDGRLQAEESSVDVRFGHDRTRVYVRWVCPANGLEFDGRNAVGTDRSFQVHVVGPGGDNVVVSEMRLVWFAMSHGVNDEMRARAIFECVKTSQ